MASTGAVWGIEIGQCALKALKVRLAEDQKLEALAFDIVEHEKILSQPDAVAEDMIRAALEKFASRNALQGDRFVIGVPGQQTFARFCKLPPADPKKIHDLVRYEASQQIPFDMDDVVWDYQKFENPESPDVEVGIFAMRKDLIRKHLEYFARVGIAPTVVQTVPSALYNFCRYDVGDIEANSATVLVDVGAQNTDLIIVEANSAWTRNIPLGGNSFTEALVRAFKLSFSKAESLKRTAASSKYARQIFQAMRPIFAELVAEIQRSIGFYSSTHRNVQLQRVVAVGNAFRLPGLQKYLENNLTIPGGVSKIEAFKKLASAPDLDAAKFADNALSLAAVYGLAIQGLGLSTITADLLPPELARIAVWKKKQYWFVGAAAVLGLASVLPWARHQLIDRPALGEGRSEKMSQVDSIVSTAKRYADEFNKVKTDTAAKEEDIKRLLDLQGQKRVVPSVIALVHEALPKDPKLAAAKTPEDLRKLIQSDPAGYARTNRKQLIIEKLDIEYAPDIEVVELSPSSGGGGFGGSTTPEKQPSAGNNPGFIVRIDGRLLYGQTQTQASELITGELYENLRKLASRPGFGMHIPETRPDDQMKISMSNPTIMRYLVGGAGGLAGTSPGLDSLSEVDPATNESIASDWQIRFAFKLKMGDAPPPQTGQK